MCEFPETRRLIRCMLGLGRGLVRRDERGRPCNVVSIPLNARSRGLLSYCAYPALSVALLPGGPAVWALLQAA